MYAHLRNDSCSRLSDASTIVLNRPNPAGAVVNLAEDSERYSGVPVFVFEQKQMARFIVGLSPEFSVASPILGEMV